MTADGDMGSLIEPRAKDEIGQLSLTVERMSEDLKKADAAVDALHTETALHRETEKELREREEYYRRLFEYSNDAVFIYDFEGRILDANNKACGMLDYSREELLKIPFQDLQTETELTRSKAAFKTGAKTGSLRFESMFRKKDGSFINVEISSSIVELKKGIMQSIVSNITERKQIERNLKESEEKFRTFMETASDLMFITDASGRFVYVNEALLRTLGYSREEMLAMQFAEILDKDNLEYAKMKRRQFVEWGEDIHHLVWETKTRKKVFGELKTTGIYDGEGRFQGIRGVFRDVTERKKVEESQRLAELGKLASDMAHEVNNQLAIISSRASIALIRNPQNEDVEKDLKTIVEQCDQVKDIVKRLLMFSKPSRGDLKVMDVLEPLNLVVNLVEDQFLKHNVKIIKKTDSHLPPVRMDGKQIQEVFMNLLRNAFEAMPDGGVITVAAAPMDDAVRIDVSDTGTGISEGDLARIFDPFFTTKENGTGLGLSVCYGIVQSHKGNLKYTSKPGEGTTASVILPAAA
jgi:PAS domain S-box-containing protein